jgi:hypothetical protein
VASSWVAGWPPMFGGKKKRAAKLEAEKDAARKIMEEAGLDLGHEAAKEKAKSSKGACALTASDCPESPPLAALRALQTPTL